MSCNVITHKLQSPESTVFYHPDHHESSTPTPSSCNSIISPATHMLPCNCSVPKLHGEYYSCKTAIVNAAGKRKTDLSYALGYGAGFDNPLPSVVDYPNRESQLALGSSNWKKIHNQRQLVKRAPRITETTETNEINYLIPIVSVIFVTALVFKLAFSD